MVSNATFITITITICVAFLSAIGGMIVLLGQRIGDVIDRLASFERGVETRLDGIGDTLVRFDERLRALENHNSR